MNDSKTGLELIIRRLSSRVGDGNLSPDDSSDGSFSSCETSYSVDRSVSIERINRKLGLADSGSILLSSSTSSINTPKLHTQSCNQDGFTSFDDETPAPRNRLRRQATSRNLQIVHTETFDGDVVRHHKSVDAAGLTERVKKSKRKEKTTSR